MKLDFTDEVAVPAGVTVSVDGRKVTVKGPKGEVSRTFPDKRISISSDSSRVVLSCKNGTKREKRVFYATLAHVKNMLRGVQQPYAYKLKVCSSHFPMTAQVSGSELIVKNFLGEKVPRKMHIPKSVTVKVAGADVTVESPDMEAAGAVAGGIEVLMFISKRDRRIFQDGIHLVEKPSKEVA